MRKYLQNLIGIFDKSNKRTLSVVTLIGAIFWWLSPDVNISVFERKEIAAVLAALIFWLVAEYNSRKIVLESVDKRLMSEVLKFYDMRMQYFLKNHHFGNPFEDELHVQLQNFRVVIYRADACFSFSGLHENFLGMRAILDALMGYFKYADDI